MNSTDSDAHLLAAMARALITDDHAGVQAAQRELSGRELGAERPRIVDLAKDPAYAELSQAIAERGVDPRVLDGVIERMLGSSGGSEPSSPLESMLKPLFAAAAGGGDVDALLAQLRTKLRAQHPDRDEAELDAFIAQFRTKLAAFQSS